MMDADGQISYVRRLSSPDETARQHARAATAGLEQRIVRGAYVPANVWAELTPDHRYRLRVRATAETRRSRPVLSHWSAAALHGLPIVGRWPNEVHVIVAPTAGGRNRNGVVAHPSTLLDDDVVEVDGLLVTSIVRTVLDIAAVGTFMQAVSMADRALNVRRFDRGVGIEPLATREELLERFARTPHIRAHAKTRSVLEFAEERADEVIESVSRVTMFVIGCPRPRLQSPFFDADGFIGEPDFEWRRHGQLGEADGDRKYLDEAYRSGRTPEQVLLDEKVREDRLRALPRGVSRWRWKVAIDPKALRDKLLRAGLPMGVPWQHDA